MLEQVKPLALSTSVPKSVGQLCCFSIHDRVVNLVNEQQQLITLHSHHNGISPMGYILKGADFSNIRTLLINNHITHLIQTPHGIQVNNTLLTANTRQLQLHVKHKFISSFAFIDRLTHQFKQNTGLFGPLSSLNKDQLAPELHYLAEQFLSLMEQNPYDLSPMIGLGPGLTPTGDDVITGILLILYSDPFSSHLLNNLSDKFNLSLLEQQTTKVSANFLHYASRGIFSANLLNVLHLIRCKKEINLTAINRLLDYGHTSGADILLGIWLGSLILQEYKYG